MWLPDGEKNLEDIFIRFNTTHERDRHTDRHAYRQTPHDGIGRAYASHRAAKPDLKELESRRTVEGIGGRRRTKQPCSRIMPAYSAVRQTFSESTGLRARRNQFIVLINIERGAPRRRHLTTIIPTGEKEDCSPLGAARPPGVSSRRPESPQLHVPASHRARVSRTLTDRSAAMGKVAGFTGPMRPTVSDRPFQVD